MIKEWIDGFLGYRDLYLKEREWTAALNEKLMEVEEEKAELQKMLERSWAAVPRRNKSK
tara:strand:- start:85 stop:261 length:177 start_codon:yes stop_codon:yes gene_type:complete